jgi:type 1 glutamine amidotransferase
MRAIILVLLFAASCRWGVTAENRKQLFNGNNLDGWTITDFGGHGPAAVEDHLLVIKSGASLSGVHWTNPLPKVNYEVELDAKRVDGSDFFCGLTFPVNDSFCTWIVGGWGGSVVGLSSIDGLDASENETSKGLFFENNKWYHLRLRVFAERIQAWIDQEKVIDVGIKGRKIDLRPGDIFLSKPLGIATFQSEAALKNIYVTELSSPRKVVFIAGTKSHGPGEHEYEKSLKLLRDCLENSTNAGVFETELHLDGWPEEDATLENAHSIVLYSDGSDRKEEAHPLLRQDRLQKIAAQMKRGAGLVAIHYTVFVPQARAGEQFLDWLGGYFDYETGTAANKWYSRIETREYDVRPASTHPITRGLTPFKMKEEFYFNIRFRDPDPRWSPVLTFGEDKDPTKVVGWAVERKDGGRGFATTGGHFYKNWWNEDMRRMLLNAIVWTAKAPVPAGGVQSVIPDTK